VNHTTINYYKQDYFQNYAPTKTFPNTNVAYRGEEIIDVPM
jgi:hypothetical protein